MISTVWAKLFEFLPVCKLCALRDYKCEAQSKFQFYKQIKNISNFRFEEVFPILINTRLKWLDLSSSLISVNNVSTIQLIKALSSAEQLTALSLAGWKFNITVKEIILIN